MYSFTTEQEIIQEDLGLIVGGVAAILVLDTILRAMMTNSKSKQIEKSLLDNYIDDFLTVKIKFKNDITPDVNILGQIFLKRKRLFSMFLKRERLTIVPNHDIAKILKTYLSEFEPFSNLMTDWSKKYKGNELSYMLDQNFSIFGNFRSSTAITWDGILKNIVTLGFSKQIPDLDNEQITNILYYIALVFRQLMLISEQIEYVEFETKKVNITHTKLI